MVLVIAVYWWAIAVNSLFPPGTDAAYRCILVKEELEGMTARM